MSNESLYAAIKVTNTEAIVTWATEQGFESVLPPEELHVTLCYSKEPINTENISKGFKTIKITGGERSVELLGDDGAVVLKFESVKLTERWQTYLDAGASWDYDGYVPHITITYKAGTIGIENIRPYTGPIELGNEYIDILNLDKAEEYKEIQNKNM